MSYMFIKSRHFVVDLKRLKIYVGKYFKLPLRKILNLEIVIITISEQF